MARSAFAIAGGAERHFLSFAERLIHDDELAAVFGPELLVRKAAAVAEAVCRA